MDISFQCGQCGRSYTISAQRAGKTVKCKACGAAVKIPPAADQAPTGLDIFGISEMEQREQEAHDDLAAREASSSLAKEKKGPYGRAKKKASAPKGFLAGVGGAILVLVPFAAWFYLRSGGDQARQAPPAPDALVANQPAPAAPANQPGLVARVNQPGLVAGVPAAPAQLADTDLEAAEPALKLPPFAPPMSQFEVEPGVMFSEIVLHSGEPDGSALPGHGGKLWLYTPAGRHPSRSLPCIFIAAAGSNLITGMALGDDDRREHLPYVRAGFAVLAYELDGSLPENDKDNTQALAAASSAFLDAEAGLINARIAIEYATRQVTAVDPRRLYAVGHSSAGTLALLLAETEPRIAACVALAPTVDLKEEHPVENQRAIAKLVPGGEQFYTRFNPRANEARIQCPIFLFYADDDQRFAAQVRDLGARLNKLRKEVTVVSAQSGGHYDSMIKLGVPRAIKWLKSLPAPAE